MKTAIDERLHYLVIDMHEGRAVYVFVGSDPAVNGGPYGEPVQLEMLPPMARFGRPGRPAAGRPVLGQARGANSFREFACTTDLWEAGFLPVASYRICDDWSDYHLPWETCPPDAQTSGSLDDSM